VCSSDLGQGAQAPGFLGPWLELPNFEDRLRWLSACAGIDLLHFGTEADAETIRDTAVAQPLLVAAGLLAALEIFPHPTDAFHVLGAAAGHSVGEITAAAGTGVISAEQAMVLVRERGRAMADAAGLKPTGMIAVVGGEATEVLAAIDRHGLTAPTTTEPARSWLLAPPSSWPHFRTTPRPRRGSSRCLWPVPSTPSTCRRPLTHWRGTRARCRFTIHVRR